MQVIQFDSHDEMRAYLQAAQEAAHRGLHSEQARLTWGDYWVQFHDIANSHVIFGRVSTAQEVADLEIDAGATAEEAAAVVDQTERDQKVDHLYGIAHDRFNIEGEYGTTHRGNIWPIEERLFNAASEVNWQIDLLPVSMKVLLEIAFRAKRAHDRANAGIGGL